MSIRKVFYRNPHNYDLDAASDEACVADFGPSLTVQSQAEDVDLNVIMKRFGVTGKMPEAAASFFGDFADGGFDFRLANEHVIAARQAFESLPWEVKDRFAQDPQRLLDFVANDKNLDEAERLGLRKPKATPVSPPAATPPAAAPAGAGAAVAPLAT